MYIPHIGNVDLRYVSFMFLWLKSGGLGEAKKAHAPSHNILPPVE